MFKLKTILPFIFASLVLSTSMGAVVYEHYCGNMVQEISLTKIEKHCQHSDTTPPCHHSKDTKDCCKTEKKSIDVDKKQAESAKDYSIVKKGGQYVTLFYVLVQYLFTKPFDSSANKRLSIQNSQPPVQECSKVITYQNFRI